MTGSKLIFDQIIVFFIFTDFSFRYIDMVHGGLSFIGDGQGTATFSDDLSCKQQKYPTVYVNAFYFQFFRVVQRQNMNMRDMTVPTSQVIYPLPFFREIYVFTACQVRVLSLGYIIAFKKICAYTVTVLF